MPSCQSCGARMVDGTQFCQTCGYPAGTVMRNRMPGVPESRTIHLRKGGRIVVDGDSVNLFINKRSVEHKRPIVFGLTGLVGLKVKRKVNWAMFGLGSFFLLIIIILFIMQITSANANPASGGVATMGPVLMFAGYRCRVLTMSYSTGRTRHFKSYNRPLLNNLASAIKSGLPTVAMEME